MDTETQTGPHGADDLNPDQREAVDAPSGPVLVVAGAGTGKTRVLTRRLARIIETGAAEPSRILGVTFTNKAAAEMRGRVADLVGGPAAELVTLGTFHAVCAGILRRNAAAAGLRGPDFSVLDEDDQRAVLDDVVRALGVEPDSGSGGARGRTRLVRHLLGRIASLKNEGITAGQARSTFTPNNPDEVRLPEIYAAYRDALLARNACDFGDLILHVVDLFRRDPAVRDAEADRFDHVLVDEFQDTNPAQYEVLRALVARHHNLTAVGDVDQAVYEWRSARPEIMLNFADDWPDARTVVLQRNYRSTRQILDAANRVVADNPRPAPKELEAAADGPDVRCETHVSDIEEADAVTSEIARRTGKGESPDEIAVLLRSARPMPAFERGLNRMGVPYAVVGGRKFHQREEVKDALAWLRLAVDPRHELAFRRVANRPARSVGDRSVQHAVDALRADPERTLADAARTAARSSRQQRTSAGLDGLAAILDALPGILAAAPDPGAAVDRILDRVGYREWRRDVLEDENWREREEALAGLVDDAARWNDAATYLQDAQLLAAQDEAPAEERVRISTVHGAKGLEFAVVFTPALEEGVLPNAAAMRQEHGLREERRIAHVAWTRAKRELVVTWAMARRGEPTEPSRFLEAAGLFEPLGSARGDAPAGGRASGAGAPRHGGERRPPSHSNRAAGFHKLRRPGR